MKFSLGVLSLLLLTITVTCGDDTTGSDTTPTPPTPLTTISYSELDETIEPTVTEGPSPTTAPTQSVTDIIQITAQEVLTFFYKFEILALDNVRATLQDSRDVAKRAIPPLDATILLETDEICKESMHLIVDIYNTGIATLQARIVETVRLAESSGGYVKQDLAVAVHKINEGIAASNVAVQNFIQKTWESLVLVVKTVNAHVTQLIADNSESSPLKIDDAVIQVETIYQQTEMDIVNEVQKFLIALGTSTNDAINLLTASARDYYRPGSAAGSSAPIHEEL